MLCIIPVFRKNVRFYLQIPLTSVHLSLWWHLAYKWVILMSFRGLLDVEKNHSINFNTSYKITHISWLPHGDPTMQKYYLKVTEAKRLGCQTDPYTSFHNTLKFQVIWSSFATRKIYSKMRAAEDVQAGSPDVSSSETHNFKNTAPNYMKFLLKYSSFIVQAWR